MMFAKIWNWALLGVMVLAAIASTIAAYSHDWDRATYFLLLMLVGKMAIDNDQEI